MNPSYTASDSTKPGNLARPEPHAAHLISSCRRACLAGAPRGWLRSIAPALVLALAAASLLTGCTTPAGAKKTTTRAAYTQVNANALSAGKPSADTIALLHRYQLDHLLPRQPDEAVRQLHQLALATGEREMLFALAELSYVAGNQIQRSVKPWDTRDPRDFYLGSAVYAWLFLFGDAKQAPPNAFDRRFREASDFYNYSLGLAFAERKRTNAVVTLQPGRRRLPVGELELRPSPPQPGLEARNYSQLLLADQFQVHGFSVRNRTAGVGTPLIAVRPLDPALGIHGALPATLLLRIEGSLADLGAGHCSSTLELYPSTEVATVRIGQNQVPLETDLTAPRAYTLSQSKVWRFGPLQFLAPGKQFTNQLILNQPFDPNRIPLVFVHGTFSSPVTWAEMANTLTLDPVIRDRYQIWSFIYGSGNPLVRSVSDLRDALSAELARLDPAKTNEILRQMLLVGHSQGGLLVKGAVIESGDQLWRLISTNRFEDVQLAEAQRQELRRRLFLEPLPFVRRVVFIATPHRGSYLAGGFARRWARRLVSLPGTMVSHGSRVLNLTHGSEAGKFLQGRLPTSLDGMSPANPALKAMADIPVAPGIKAHSIIAIRSSGDYHHGRDGLVSYQSAHLDGVESEFIVRSSHSCLKNPATIQEVRRILLEHLHPEVGGR